MFAPALIYPAAAQFAGFVEKLYTDLVLPLAIPVALLSLVVAGIMWIAGNSRGVMRALEVLGGVCLVGFGPYIVNTIYTTAQNFAK